jgi:predicted aspartyl protease
MSALLDTGGDVTAIPRALVNILRLYKVGQIQIEGVEGAPNIFHLYAVKLKLNGITIPRVEVIATDLDIVVVGRDVLNQFYFLLNGPEQTFDLRQTSFL